MSTWRARWKTEVNAAIGGTLVESNDVSRPPRRRARGLAWLIRRRFRMMFLGAVILILGHIGHGHGQTDTSNAYSMFAVNDHPAKVGSWTVRLVDNGFVQDVVGPRGTLGGPWFETSWVVTNRGNKPLALTARDFSGGAPEKPAFGISARPADDPQDRAFPLGMVPPGGTVSGYIALRVRHDTTAGRAMFAPTAGNPKGDGVYWTLRLSPLEKVSVLS